MADQNHPLGVAQSSPVALREALAEALAVIADCVGYRHSGDPWEENAFDMGELDIHDYARDGRLERAKALLAAQPPAAPVIDGTIQEGDVLSYEMTDGVGKVTAHVRPPAAPVETDGAFDSDPISRCDLIYRLRNPMWAHSNAPFEGPQLEQEENLAAMNEAAAEIERLRAHSSAETEELLHLADEFEAGLRKCAASGYEEYGPEWQRKRQLVIDALREKARC